jgi:hypothetical protein
MPTWGPQTIPAYVKHSADVLVSRLTYKKVDPTPPTFHLPIGSLAHFPSIQF